MDLFNSLLLLDSHSYPLILLLLLGAFFLMRSAKRIYMELLGSANLILLGIAVCTFLIHPGKILDLGRMVSDSSWMHAVPTLAPLAFILKRFRQNIWLSALIGLFSLNKPLLLEVRQISEIIYPESYYLPVYTPVKDVTYFAGLSLVLWVLQRASLLRLGGLLR